MHFLAYELQRVLHFQAIPWEDMRNKTILITGATGLIGKACILTLYLANKKYNLNLRIAALTRNPKAAQQVFPDIPNLSFYQYELTSPLPIFSFPIHFIIHTASITQSQQFIKLPIETIKSSVISIENILNFAQTNHTLSTVYLSSSEVYGPIISNKRVPETQPFALKNLSVRNSYPAGKIIAEQLCYSYHIQHNCPVKIARLTLTTGPGLSSNDNRVFSQFAKSAVNKQNLILHSAGKSKRDYLYITDAISALLIILLKGENGSAYNVANSQTYSSIKQLANHVCQEYGLQLIIDKASAFTHQYAPHTEVNLDTTRLEALGWKAEVSLNEMLNKTVQYLSQKTDKTL